MTNSRGITKTYNKNCIREKAKEIDIAYQLTINFIIPCKTQGQKAIENVLALQGRGSLRSFGCGVSTALARDNIKIDIVDGTSHA